MIMVRVAIYRLRCKTKEQFMSEDFAPHTSIQWNGTVGTVQYGGGDKSMVAIFYTRPHQDLAKSNEQGRPIFEDKVYVRIHPPGERLNIVDRPANITDQRRFPMQWQQFRENQQQIPDGTPVDLMYPNKPSIAAMLKAHGVWTVEQLATLSGDAIENIGMGSQTYVNDAGKYLAMAQKGVGASQLRTELEARDRTIATQAHEIQMLKDQMTKFMEQQTQNVDIATIQQLLANVQGQRGVYPASAPKQMPQVFDAATAQINATSPTAEIARQKKPTRKRVRIED
jgi:hypothetical protein